VCNLNKQGIKAKDNTFDTIVIAEVMGHLYRPEETVQEMYRVLKPGGIVIVTVPHTASFSNLLDVFREKSFKKRLDDTTEGIHHINSFGAREMTNSLKLAGFSILRVKRICCGINTWKVHLPDWDVLSPFADSLMVIARK